ncbi:MAG: carboxypeptidase-like regulatory domain-containing protein [Gilvibacter sp.]
MNNTTIVLTIVIILLFGSGAFGQDFQATVVDKKSGAPIPFATVQTGQYSGTITNEEGVFTLTDSAIARLKDSIFISSMGYEKVGLWVGEQTDVTVALTAKTFELGQVFLSSENLDPKEIIERVKNNMDANYKAPMTKKKIFFRQSDFSDMQQVDFKVKESSIPELNQALMNQITGSIAKQSAYYRESVGDFYGDYYNHKLHLDKGAELYDKSKDISVDGLTEKLERIFKDNVKRDSYLKIKSGIFGTKVQLDSVANAQAEEQEKVVKIEDTDDQNFHDQTVSRISDVYNQLFFIEDSELDFLSKSNRYRFEMDDYSFIDEAAVYVIHFEPKGKKDFRGTMYVNTDDYAIMRLEYTNVRPIQKFGLLGITYRRNVLRGKMLFSKDQNGSYSPRYLELEDGEIVGVDRPLKVIEKNKNVKGRRKQNELSMDINVKVSTLNKYELVVFDSQDISQSDYNQATQNKSYKASYLSAYDPNFWNGLPIIEPNAAIQAFKVVE